MKRFLALLIVLSASPALADTPLPPPEKTTVCSSAKKVCAVSDPATRTTVVSSRVSRPATWTISGWHRWLFVSDDGKSVVVGYSGINLVPVDVTLKQPVLYFYNYDKLIRTVTLGDLYRSKSQLKRTASHLAWGSVSGINASNQVVVELVDGRKLAFSASTGRPQAHRPDSI
jgi:hypothetical protein